MGLCLKWHGMSDAMRSMIIMLQISKHYSVKVHWERTYGNYLPVVHVPGMPMREKRDGCAQHLVAAARCGRNHFVLSLRLFLGCATGRSWATSRFGPKLS